MSPSPIARYQSRLEELESLKAELQAPQRQGDPAPVVGLALEAAGDVLRRTQALRCETKPVEAALALIPPAALQSWAASVSVDTVTQRLIRAADHAVEAAVPDAGDDVPVLVNFAMQDLMQRDRLESALASLEQLAKQGRADAGAVVQRLAGELKQADARAQRSVAGLTVLNTERRAEAALLDDTARARAWWLTARATLADDALVKVLAGEARGSLEARERDVSALVSEPRTRHIGFDDLLRYDVGLASPAERIAIQTAGVRDAEMKQVLAAMAAGDEAIAEVLGGSAQAPGQVSVERAPGAAKPELVEETEDFKVLVFRARRVTVLVQPQRVDRFAAAAVVLADRPGTEVPGHSVADGLEFDLGSAAALSGRTARVSVRLKSGQTVNCELAL